MSEEEEIEPLAYHKSCVEKLNQDCPKIPLYVPVRGANVLDAFSLDTHIQVPSLVAAVPETTPRIYIRPYGRDEFGEETVNFIVKVAEEFKFRIENRVENVRGTMLPLFILH